ncbi:MAG: hydroxymethylglutaryl-CoA lyase [Thermodesulfobacteriota bacterium]
MTSEPIHETEIIALQEVAPRDGLQNEPIRLAPELRAELVDSLADAGLRRIQIGACVNPARVPQMAGTDQVWRLITRKEGVRHTVLVLNERGLDEALAAGIGHVEIYISASETHSRKNANTTVEESLRKAAGMIRRAAREGLGVLAGVMCAFGCFYEGAIPAEKLRELVLRLSEARPDRIALADTTGMGTREEIRAAIEAIRDAVSPASLSLHLHDTHGRGFENLRAGLDLGVRSFDSSVGGLGGCPFIPGARGNISTEGTVALVESLGFRTGVDLHKLALVKARLTELLGGPLDRYRAMR